MQVCFLVHLSLCTGRSLCVFSVLLGVFFLLVCRGGNDRVAHLSHALLISGICIQREGLGYMVVFLLQAMPPQCVAWYGSANITHVMLFSKLLQRCSDGTRDQHPSSLSSTVLLRNATGVAWLFPPVQQASAPLRINGKLTHAVDPCRAQVPTRSWPCTSYC